MDRAAVVNYLRERPGLLKACDKEIVRHLKTEGLVSPTTYYGDINVRSLVQQAGATGRRCPACGHRL
jgi:hypothetical protein